MKKITFIFGVLLIVFSLISFGFQGVNYTQREKVAEVGNLKLSADKEKIIYIPPVVSAIALVAGIALIIGVQLKK